MNRWRRILATALCAAAVSPALQAQSGSETFEVDPVSCWWRTEAGSVRVGEAFSLLLTCSVLETEAAKAVIDRSRLGAAAVQFAPFEVMSGVEADDHLTAGRRFMQYEYLLRILDESSFGRDVTIPALAISYHIESRVEQGGAVQGRDQTYSMQPLLLRVQSLVPSMASQTREPGVPTFADIADRQFRAGALRLVALILFGVAALMVVVAVLRWIRTARADRGEAARHLLPNRVVLGGVRSELQDLHRDTRAGWTPEAVARALAASRIVASYLAGHAVSQREIQTRADVGELEVGGGLLSRRKVAVTGTTTAISLNQPGSAAAGDVAASDMDTALLTLTRARYGRADTLDRSSLDDALATASRAADRVAARHTVMAQTTGAIARGLKPKAWAR